jgi:uncharacterized membrane protein YciS (DUF1049 family)
MAKEQWHLSKSVPISFIVAIICQTAALVWFVASLQGSIETNARDLVRHETRIEALETSVQSQAVSLARMSENIQAIRDMVERMAASR